VLLSINKDFVVSTISFSPMVSKYGMAFRVYVFVEKEAVTA
jgi:hypothetical protein